MPPFDPALLSPLPSLGKTMQVRHLFSVSHCLELTCALRDHQCYSVIWRKRQETKNLHVHESCYLFNLLGFFPPVWVLCSFKRSGLPWKDSRITPSLVMINSACKGREDRRLQGDWGGKSYSTKMGACTYTGERETAGRSREDNRPQKQWKDLPMDQKGFGIIWSNSKKSLNWLK